MLSGSANRPMQPMARQRPNRCQERDVGEAERGDRQPTRGRFAVRESKLTGAASVETSQPALGPQTMRNARSVEGQQRYANGQLSTLLSAAPTSGPCLAWAGGTGDPCTVPSEFTLSPRGRMAATPKLPPDPFATLPPSGGRGPA